MGRSKKAASAAPPKRGKAAAKPEPAKPAKPAKKTRARQATLPDVVGDGDDAALNAAITKAYEATQEWQDAQKAMVDARKEVQDLLTAKDLLVYVSNDSIEAKRNRKEATEKLTLKKSNWSAGVPGAPADSGDDDDWGEE